ncbi:hypothetical protein Tco_0917263 [Tanacetum coccineum]
MNRISSRRLSTITYVLWQFSQNISCVSKGKGLFGPNGGKSGKEEVGFDNFGGGGEEFGNYGGNEGEVGGVGNKSSMGSMLMANGEEYLDGWVGAGGGEVKGGGVNFGVTKSLLGEIPGESTEESGGEEFGVEGGAVW